MTIDQPDVVDFARAPRDSDEVVLMICDHLPWSEDDDPTYPPEMLNTKEHMLLMQEKINAYLGFIESGEIYEKYPKAIGKKARLEVVAKYPMNDEAKELFAKFKDFLFRHGYEIDFVLLRGD